MTDFRKNLYVLILTTLLVFSFAEVGVRVVADDDLDGNKVVREKILFPYNFPAEFVNSQIDKYQRKMKDSPEKVNYLYDSRLGWVGNPAYKLGKYRNVQSIRAKADRVFPKQPEEGKFRIALFGDSFTQSSNVTIEESWGYLLEQKLRKAGMNAEVLNFGVGGYGIDQAYLRWKVEGKDYDPHLVILGFYPVDVKRGTRIFNSSGMPFSKPCFVMKNDTIELVNSPTVPIENMVEEIKMLPASELGLKDVYLSENIEDYQWRWWRFSSFLSLLEANLRQNRFTNTSPRFLEEYYDVEKYPAKLALKIVETFKNGAEKANSKFMVVYMPSYTQVYNLQKDEPLVAEALIKSLKKIAPVVRTESEITRLANEIGMGALFASDGHFNAPGYAVVADMLTSFVLKNYHSGAKEEKIARK